MVAIPKEESVFNIQEEDPLSLSQIFEVVVVEAGFIATP